MSKFDYLNSHFKSSLPAELKLLHELLNCRTVTSMATLTVSHPRREALGGSMVNLPASGNDVKYSDDDDGGEGCGLKSPGLLRRAFSSRKHKKKKPKPGDVISPCCSPSRSSSTLINPGRSVDKLTTTRSSCSQLKPPALVFSSDNLLSPDSCCR